VRISVHMLDTYNRVSRSTQTIIARTGREPTLDELEKLDKVKDLYADTPFSLDRPVGDEDGRRFIDFLVEENSASPYDNLASQKWAEECSACSAPSPPSNPASSAGASASITRTSSRSRKSATSTT
jgi:DNA-directed RNA polymerase sigma subunit (sigma70/sigma32)